MWLDIHNQNSLSALAEAGGKFATDLYKIRESLRMSSFKILPKDYFFELCCNFLFL